MRFMHAATEVEDTGGLSCRNRVAADCGNMVFDSGSCRAVESGDCSTDGEIPGTITNGVAACNACPATEVEDTDGLSCRARVAADCGAMVFDSGLCRAAVSGDCSTDGEIPGTITNGVAACDSCSATEVEDTAVYLAAPGSRRIAEIWFLIPVHAAP